MPSVSIRSDSVLNRVGVDQVVDSASTLLVYTPTLSLPLEARGRGRSLMPPCRETGAGARLVPELTELTEREEGDVVGWRRATPVAA